MYFFQLQPLECCSSTVKQVTLSVFKTQWSSEEIRSSRSWCVCGGGDNPAAPLSKGITCLVRYSTAVS